jgi:hypothetical protein
MRIVVSPAGEYIDIVDGNPGEFYPFELGTHSCGGEATLHDLSDNWRVIVCRSCNFRQLVPARVALPGIMADFFNHLKSLGSDNWNSLPVIMQAKRLALDFRVSGGTKTSETLP